jgi:cytidylate kinase
MPSTMIANTQIVSILGGPGSGKGTQCALLQQRFLCAHLSVGDVLRAEAAKPDSVYASIIAENMRLGRVGPKEITVDILQTHMEEALDAGVRTFFLDGVQTCHDEMITSTRLMPHNRLSTQAGPGRIFHSERCVNLAHRRV